MTFFFNLSILETETQCNPKLMVEQLCLYYNKKFIPKNYSTKIKPLRNLQGNSFLLNPADFFLDNKTDITYKSHYIQLAGRRDYSSYKFYDIKYLDLSYFSDIDINRISTNPLLTFKENKIHFKYEEK
jgi:hypothetical protein